MHFVSSFSQRPSSFQVSSHSLDDTRESYGVWCSLCTLAQFSREKNLISMWKIICAQCNFKKLHFTQLINSKLADFQIFKMAQCVPLFWWPFLSRPIYTDNKKQALTQIALGATTSVPRIRLQDQEEAQLSLGGQERFIRLVFLKGGNEAN